MTDEELRQQIKDALLQIAPEADPDAVPPTADLREELDLDSMDYLNFVIALHEALGLEIPEVDYPALATMESGIVYLRRRLAEEAG